MWKASVAATAAVLVSWLFGLWADPPDNNIRGVIHEILYLTGTLSWVYMAMAITIAARPAWIERKSGIPLDKLYSWHRGLGIAGAAIALLHYLVKPIYKTSEPFIKPLLSNLEPVMDHPPLDEAQLTTLELAWKALRPFSIDSSIFATWIIILLIISVYIKKLGYARWFKMHKLFSIIFLVLCVHAIRLLESSDFFLPFGWITLAATLVGAWYSAILLVKGAGFEKNSSAVVKEIQKTDGAVKLVVAPEKRLDVSLGQFVFLQTPGHEKHPFSAAEVREDGSIVLLIKALGDYTREVVPNLKPGDEVIIEGGWGGFTCDMEKKKQVWIAAGIGIAPFCSWMQQLAEKKCEKLDIDLHWCVKDQRSEGWLGWVESLARRAGVKLTIHESRVNRLVPYDLFINKKPALAAVCASRGLKKEVFQAWRRSGGSRKDILHEEFEWRR